MINSYKHIQKHLAALFLGCFFVLLQSCENDIKAVQELGKKTTGVEEGINIESYLSQEGKMKAKLIAPLMLRYLLDTPRVVFPKSLHVDFYDSLTTIESQLSCKYGRYIENENKVFLRDSVVVFNRSGDTLWTNELYWDQNKSTFYTDKPCIVSINSPGSPRQKQFAHKGIIADQNFRWFTLNIIDARITGDSSFIDLPDSTY